MDAKLGEGYAAQGWRVEEAWPGGGIKGNWKYISPSGASFSSLARARCALHQRHHQPLRKHQRCIQYTKRNTRTLKNSNSRCSAFRQRREMLQF